MSVRTSPVSAPSRVLLLQGITLAWMLLECGLSLFSAARAHSPALLAFGADSAVELLSAAIVLLQYSPRLRIPERLASRLCGGLLFALAAVVLLVVALSLLLHAAPERSLLGIAVTLAALLVMPILAALKRREARRRGDLALAADAVQSATCAWLAFITLIGLATSAWLHRGWLDSLAALAIIPFLIKEGREAWRGHVCTCC